MALQSSGPIDISDIQTELGSSSGSLRALSASAGKSIPDAMSEFYGYSNFTAAGNFAPIAYTGNGSTQSISTGFQPDLVWIKNRVSTYGHCWFDSIRGTNNVLQCNSTAAESTVANTLTSFNSNGFSLGSNGNVNANNNTYIAWCWKAGNGTSTNTNGSVTSTVSVNQAAGFSIIKFTSPGPSNTPFSVGHGLSSAPDLIILKDTDTNGTNWPVYSSSFSSPATTELKLNYYQAISSSTAWDSSNPTSSVINLRSGSGILANKECIIYAFTSIPGYSKIGAYTATGSAQTITTGFQPRFVMIKCINIGNSATTFGWNIFDSARGLGSNTPYLLASEQSTEQSGTNNWLSVTSNGFTLNSYWLNGGGWGDHFYMAFA